MRFLVCRLLSITTVLCVYMLVVWSGFSFLVLAQEPTPFEISLIPQAEYAVAGDLFTYTVVVTNVSQTLVEDVYIKVKIPPGTIYIDERYTDPKWYSYRPQPGTPIEEMEWYTPDAVAPGEVFTSHLMVKVTSETEQTSIINGEYVVITAQDEPLALGSPIRTQLLTPTPTLTPRFSPTLMNTDTPTPTSTAAVTATPMPETSATPDHPTATIAATTLAQTDAVATSTPTLPPITSQDEASENTSSFISVVATIGAIAALVIIGVIGFLRRK